MENNGLQRGHDHCAGRRQCGGGRTARGDEIEGICDAAALPWMARIHSLCMARSAEAIERARAGLGPTLRRVQSVPSVRALATSSLLRGVAVALSGARVPSPSSANAKSTKRRCVAILCRGSAASWFRAAPSLASAKADDLSSRITNEMQEGSHLRRSRVHFRSSSPHSSTTTLKLGESHGTNALYRRGRCGNSSGNAARPQSAVFRSESRHDGKPPVPGRLRQGSCARTPISETAEIGIGNRSRDGRISPGRGTLPWRSSCWWQWTKWINEAPRFRYMTGATGQSPHWCS